MRISLEHRAAVLVGTVGAASAVALLSSCDRGPAPETCYDVCGEGTRCENGRCVAEAPLAVEDDPADPSPAERKGKRRRGKRGDAEPAPEKGGETFVPVDDSHIPRYDPRKTEVLDMNAGSERLGDRTIADHMRRLEPKFNDCIETAARHSDQEIRGGKVDFVFGIAPSGKVTSVTVKAPTHLDVFGIVPCLRKAVYDHRFPSFDGPPMGVDYSFEVG